MRLIDQYRLRGKPRPAFRPDATTGLRDNEQRLTFDALRVRPGESDHEAWERIVASQTKGAS